MDIEEGKIDIAEAILDIAEGKLEKMGTGVSPAPNQNRTCRKKSSDQLLKSFIPNQVRQEDLLWPI